MVGAVTAVVSVALGLLLSYSEDYSDPILPVHQWLGIGTMSFALLTAVAYFRKSRLAQRTSLILTVAGVLVAGHFGAVLTHGEDYLTSSLPSNKATENKQSALTFAANPRPLSEDQVQEINLEVRTILAHNCYSCHGRAKAKGKLRLDTREFLMKGGEDGVVVVPGHPEESEMVRRINLPAHHKKRMPAKGKGLTKEEIALIRFWIQKGAPPGRRVPKKVYTVWPPLRHELRSFPRRAAE